MESFGQLALPNKGAPDQMRGKIKRRTKGGGERQLLTNYDLHKHHGL